jgi:hypothetical protein
MGQARDLRPNPQQPRGYLGTSDDIVLRPCLKQEKRCQLGLAEDELSVRVSHYAEVTSDHHSVLVGQAWNPYFVRVRLPPQVFQARYFIAMDQ